MNDATPHEETQSVDDDSLLKTIAPWVWIMLGGIGSILLMSMVIKTMYHDAGRLPGPWSWTQLIVGITLMIGAHCSALRHAMRRDRRVALGDFLTGWVTIWAPTISTLPDGHRRIWSLSWGTTLAVASVMIIGGQNFSQLFSDVEPVEKEEKMGNAFGKVVGKAAAVARKNGKKAATLEEALKNIAEGNEMQAYVGELAELTELKEGFGEIFGYLPGQEGMPSRVLICSRSSNGIQYVGRVSAVDISPEAMKLIALKIANQECDEPVCSCDESAVWVNPVTRCRLRYARIAADGTFEDLQIVSVVRKNVGTSSRTQRPTSRNSRRSDSSSIR